MREKFIGMIMAYRDHHAAQISRLSAAVDRLSENRQDEQIRLVFEHVMSDLDSWIQKNRTINLSEDGVQQPLVEAIDGTRYASTIRAAVRRYGDWDNLDYYHHLSYGVRKLGVEQIGSKINSFEIIATNLIDNDSLAPAKGYLEGVIGRIDAAVDEAYRRIQSAGREAFKQTLAKDVEFWSKCESRWGQGPGYRTAIRDMTDEEFAHERLTEVEKLVVAMLEDEWAEIVELMESMLQDKALATAGA
jgi:hypothetical protein